MAASLPAGRGGAGGPGKGVSPRPPPPPPPSAPAPRAPPPPPPRPPRGRPPRPPPPPPARAPDLPALAAVAVGAVPASAAGHHGGSSAGHRHHPRAGAEIFQVGTAVEDITPTRPQYLGGFGQMDAPTAQVHDPLQVRAFAVASGTKVVEFAIVDTQGYFAGYQEGPFGITDARQTAARWLAGHGYPGTTEADMIVSSTHSHAAPTLMGIWGPVDVDYLKHVHD